MSGRDMRNFVSVHRAGDEEHLVRRMKDGLNSSKYKVVDYDHLREVTMQKRISGQLQLAKVHKLKHLSTQSKEQHLLKQHRAAWHRELLRLNHARKRTQAEIDILVKNNMDGELLSPAFRDFEYYDFGLDREFQEFKQGTVEPVWNLREDLAYWVNENQGPSLNLSRDGVELEDPYTVRKTLDRVKQQQDNVLAALRHEQHALEADIHKVTSDMPELLLKPKVPMLDTGIPDEAFDIECPDFNLKVTLLQEFIMVDGKYTEKLNELETQHSGVIRNGNGGWSDEDHLWFTWILDQYPRDLPKHRTLFIDRLRRQLPHYNRQQIVEHETWWLLNKYYHERRRDLMGDWQRDRTELLNRVRVVMDEACRLKKEQETLGKNREKQQEMCAQLCAKVQSWRVEKFEAARLEAELAEKRQKEAMLRLQEEELQERKNRDKQKQQIQEYQRKQEVKKREKEAESEAHLEVLRQQLAEQAVHDQQRVKFRQEEYTQKEMERQRQLEEREAEREEKERILEAIRMQVRPHVECDLLRLWQETESWKARQIEEPEPGLQRPLFDVKSFTSKQIMSDPRMKLETRLREAGVHESAYARQAMASVKPLQPTRRDMASTVFKQDQVPH